MSPLLAEPARPWSSAAPAWHAVDGLEALALAGAEAGGLTSAEAAHRLVRDGPNVLPRARRDGPLRLAWRQVHNPLIWILLAAAALAIALGKTLDGLVVLGVVVANAVLGFVQELRAGRAIEALLDLVPEHATVRRDGVPRSLAAAELVRGDVVELAGGDKVPADVRLLAAHSLQVDESPLTGESLPVDKGPAPVEQAAQVGDRSSMAFGGTLVTYGTATAVVVATGAGTELGRISELLERAQAVETPLTRGIARVARWLTVAIAAAAAALFAVGVARGYEAGDALLAAIALAVGAIPEALPAVVTIALAIGVQRMARRRALVRLLPAVETLGSTTVICSDKTGTLTRNEMAARELWTPAGVGEEALLRAAVLCADAAGNGSGGIDGEPTEAALVAAALGHGLDVEAERAAAPREDAVPFDSAARYMATLHRRPEGRAAIVKGAPEVVLALCGEAVPPEVEREIERLAGGGMRVLAVAERAAAPGGLDAALASGGFRLLGLAGLSDPPRPEAAAAVAACRRAGIEVKMITGDHPRTAETIGRELGLLGPDGVAVTGAGLDEAGDAELPGLAARTQVFARVSPEHKLRLVRALQARGEVVAMTGDGVNDAPALKQADIGVAMGVGGTSVAKEAADVVLADDDFATIAAAVEEGRRIYDNLVKALAFVLPTNLGFALAILASVLFFPLVDGEPLQALSPVQLLWINLVATPLLSLPLALEARERDVMGRPPRVPGAPILSRFVLGRTAVVALLMAAGAIVLFLVRYDADVDHGVPHDLALAEAQTLAATTIVLFQCLYLLQCRSLRGSLLSVGLWSNPWVYGGIAALLALQAGFVHLPVLNSLFGSAPLDAAGWLLALAVALSVLPVVAAEKAWRRRRAARSAR